MTDDRRSIGQRWADAVTAFSGSWTFIGAFTAITFAWIVLNAIAPSWDPYPFLFLNWVLTVVSTLQNPLILLSQNRQNDVEREHAQEIRQELTAIRAALDRLEKR